MIKSIVCLFVGFLLFTGCSTKNPEKFIQEREKTFSEISKIEDAIVLDRFGLILYPVYRNTIYHDSSKFKIVCYGYGSSYSGRDLQDGGIVNYFWRRANKIDSMFSKLFDKDVLIVNRIEFDENISKNKDTLLPAFSILHVVDRDADKNGIFDEENDPKSLYLFNYSDLVTKKLTPDSINVLNINYSGFIAGGFRTSSSAGLFFYSKENDIQEIYANNYLILFDGVVNKDTCKYLYHLKDEKLENVSKAMKM